MAVIETTMKNDPGVHEDQEGNRTESEKTDSRNENETKSCCFDSVDEDEEESSSLLRNGHDSASSNDLILLDLDEKLEKKHIMPWHEWYWPEEYFEERYQRPLNFFSGLSPTAKDDSALEQCGRDDWSSGLSFARLSQEQQSRRIDKKKPLKPCLKPSSYSRTSPKQVSRTAVQKRFSMEQVCLQNARPAMRRCSYSRLPPPNISKDGGTLDENVEEPPASCSTLFENASRATVPLTYQSLGELPPVLPQRRSTIVFDKFKAKSFNHLMLEEEDTHEEIKLEKEEQDEDRHIQFSKTIQVVHIPPASQYPADIWTALWGSRRYEERRRRLRRKRRERQLERQVDDDAEDDGDDRSTLLARKAHLSQQERRRSSDITCAPEDLGVDYDEEDDEDDYEEWEDDNGDRHDEGEGCVVYISKEVLDRLDAATRPKIEPVAVSA